MAKLLTNQLLSINVYTLSRQGAFVEGVVSTQDLLLGDQVYSYTDTSYEKDILSVGFQKVRIQWRECHFGGASPIFICSGCNCNSVVLYECGSFRCRKCLNLAYSSQNEQKLDRTIRKLKKLRKKYEWEGGLSSPVPCRKKRQRVQTYNQYQTQYSGEIHVLSKVLRKAFARYY